MQEMTENNVQNINIGVFLYAVFIFEILFLAQGVAMEFSVLNIAIKSAPMT